MILTVIFVAAAAAAASSSTGSPWSQGDYGKLVFGGGPGTPSYTYSYGTTRLTSSAGSLDGCSVGASTTGTDPRLGDYNQLELGCGAAGILAVRYHTRLDAFVFLRFPKTAALPTTWPSLNVSQMVKGTKCIGWAEHYFFPGTVGPRIPHTNPHPVDLRSCESDGPLFFTLGNATAGTDAIESLAVSPLSHFTSNMVSGAGADFGGMGVDAAGGHCGGKAKCALFETQAVLIARPGITRATRAFGSVLRQARNTTRRRGPGVTQLSYWNDNQAGYSWWTVGPDQEVWGKPEDIYLKLKAGYDKAGIPVRGWEPDNNWLVTYKDGNEWGNGTGVAKNWIGNQWDYNPELYPSGGQDFCRKLGNLSMTYYTNGFGPNNVYASNKSWQFQKNNEPHPNASYAFYHHLFSHASEQYNMEMLFTDFLCYRGPAMGAYQDTPAGEEGEHMWLGGMTKAAGDTGSEVQYCMAVAHQILMTSEFPEVTNCRVNGDGGLDTGHLVIPSLLASTVGLGWSKDNLRTADRCFVDGLYPNGTVKWPCGSINKGEGTSGAFKMQVEQTVLATLSLGPVGIADQLTSYPTNASADITTNKTLIMATCAATGDLLQPGYPITPLDQFITGYVNGAAPGWGWLWGSYTAVPSGASGGRPNLWYLAFGGGATVRERDLAPMVDASALPAPTFDAIPTGGFKDAGLSFPNSSLVTAHVAWKSAWLEQALRPGDGCGPISVVELTAGGVDMGAEDTILNVAPVFAGTKALLGEAGKITAVSTHRFSSIAPSTGGGVVVGLRGKAGEVVNLLVATKKTGAGYSCSTKAVPIGSDGTAVVTI